MSSSRNAKSFQIVESKWWLCSSRVFTGQRCDIPDMFGPAPFLSCSHPPPHRARQLYPPQNVVGSVFGGTKVPGDQPGGACGDRRLAARAGSGAVRRAVSRERHRPRCSGRADRRRSDHAGRVARRPQAPADGHGRPCASRAPASSATAEPSGGSSPSCSSIWSARPRCPRASTRRSCARSSMPIRPRWPPRSPGFEGHVAKFMGDGVLAYFGWPRAHEDEAERAVRAGLATTAAVARLSLPDGRPAGGPGRHRDRARRGRRPGRRGRRAGGGGGRRDAEPRRPPAGAGRAGTVVVAARHPTPAWASCSSFTDLGAQQLAGFADPIAAFRVATAAGGREPVRGAPRAAPDATGRARARARPAARPLAPGLRR